MTDMTRTEDPADEAFALMHRLDSISAIYQERRGEPYAEWSPRMTDNDRQQFESCRLRFIALLEDGAFGPVNPTDPAAVQ